MSDSAPPVFQLHGQPLLVPGIVGERAQTHLMVRNAGGAGRGVRVAVFGDSLDRELLVLERGDLFIVQGESRKVIETRFRRPANPDNRRIYVADLDIPIAAAVNDERLTSRQWYSAIEILHANIELRVANAGQGSLFIGFAPLTHGEGAFEAEIPVHTVEAGQPLPVYSPPPEILAEMERRGKKTAPRLPKPKPK